MEIVFQSAFAGQDRLTTRSGVDGRHGDLASLCFRRCFAVVEVELGTTQCCETVRPMGKIATADRHHDEQSPGEVLPEIGNRGIRVMQDRGQPGQKGDVEHSFDDEHDGTARR